MGEVVCFETRQKIETPPPQERGDTITVIESIHQRRHQLDGTIIIGISKISESPVFLCSADEYERRILWTFFMEYMHEFAQNPLNQTDESTSLETDE